MRLRAGLAGLAMLLAAAAPTQAQTVTVFAAASTKNALEEASAAHAAGGGARAVLAFASSAALAKQIERGAPADLYVSASAEWMDYLSARGLVLRASRVDLLRNRLVLVASASSAVRLEIAPGFPLAARLGGGRLSMGDPAHVPAGRYAQAALESLGVWAAVRGRIAPAEHVRAALALVARGEAPLGVVYATDAAAEPGVRVAGTFPARSHPPIVYPAALVAGRRNAAAAPLLAYLRSAAAREIFARHGFAPAD